MPPIGSFIVFFAIVVFVVVLWKFLGDYVIKEYYMVNPEKAGQRGDTYGILNSLFAALAFAGLVYTILLQQKELKETRQEFIQQNETLKLQRFENTLFNLLAARSKLISEFGAVILHSSPVRYVGVNVVTNFNSELKSRIGGIDYSSIKELGQEHIDVLRKFYNQTSFLGFGNFVELYVSNLYSILKFIRDAKLFEWDGERDFYFSIVRSQLSLDERTFLYYYMAICDPNSIGGKYLSRMRSMETEYKFNKYTNEFLFDKSHYKLQASWGGFEYYDDDDDEWE